MNLVILASTFIVTFFFKKDAKFLLFIVLILFPFFGLIEIILNKYSILSSIFFDFVFFIPLYLICFFNFHLKFNEKFLQKINFYLLVYVGFITLYIFLPFNNFPLLGKLIGLKVWIFYLYFIYVGFFIIDSKKNFNSIINILSIGAIVPSSITIIQYIIAVNFGPEKAFFLVDKFIDPFEMTQGYTSFDLGIFKIYRLNSTFNSITELSNYLFCMLVPVIYAQKIENTNLLKKLNQLSLLLLFFAIIFSGSRSSYIILPFFLFTYLILKSDFKKIYLYFFILFIVIILFRYNSNNELNFFFLYIYELSYMYFFSFVSEFKTIIFENFWGNGVGTVTNSVGKFYNFTEYFKPFQNRSNYDWVNERYFQKIVFETGITGMLLYFVVFSKIIFYPLKVCRFNVSKIDREYLTLVTAFLINVTFIWGFKGNSRDLFPLSFLQFFFLGTALKIVYLNNAKN